MASTDTDVPAEMEDRGAWYGHAADYWKVRNLLEMLIVSSFKFRHPPDGLPLLFQTDLNTKYPQHMTTQ